MLFAYLVSHFVNHALGNISMDALAAGVYLHTLFWQFLPVTIVFYAACLVHTGLGIWALYQRRQFRWKAIEPLQLVLGLSIPALIITHIVGVRLGQTLFGHEKLYPQVFYAYWIAWPYKMWLMFVVLIVAWVHGCIGLYFWLRMKAFFKRAAPFLLAAAVLVPTLAMLGLYQGGRTVVADSDDAEWRRDNLSPRQVGTMAQQQTLDQHHRLFPDRLSRPARTCPAGQGRARAARAPRRHDQPVLRQRPDGPGAEGAERAGGEPAQQRTPCQRLRRPRALLHLPHPHHRRLQRAARTLAARSLRARPGRRRRSVDPPRLPVAADRPISPSSSCSCRTRCRPIRHASNPTRIGQERYLVSMFVDMRGSTKLAEKRLPFDTVFIVNRFLGAVSQAVIESGGRPNQFVGDGMLALFGLSSSRQEACRQALKAAAMIAANVDELNKFLEHDLREPIRFGIGIHGGEVIVGDIGYRDHMVFTALGDAVNVAARLQDMTKSSFMRGGGFRRSSHQRGPCLPMRCRSRKSRSAAATSR